MKRPDPNIHNISQWLEIATKDLAPSARKRITAEIETHYADALESHLAENQNPTDASINALKDLGDPDKAAEVYRKKYLTLEEDEAISGLNRRLPCYHWFVTPLYFVLLILLAISPKSNMSPYALAACFVVAISISLVSIHSQQLIKMLPDRRAANGLMLIEPLRAAGLLLFLLVTPTTILPWFLKTLWIVQAAYETCHWLRIRSKLLNSGGSVQLQT